ncbi:MAG: sigma-70 family RNA polymerase sigma factor [Lachnospiraceae bacterium]|nr:sigma-70 family RNA polymerase sigma factor [Lachnospiraceae bacterium]
MSNEEIVFLIQSGIEPQRNTEKLYMQNLPMIKRICKPYTSIEPLEDLIQTAYMGLVEAIGRYDSTRGIKFFTYAEYWIKQSIRQYLDHSQLIRIPLNMNNLLYRYKRFLTSYESDHTGLLPTDEEITHELRISIDQLQDIRKYLLCDGIGSLDSPTGEAGENTMLDFIASPDSMEESTIDSVYQQEMTADIEKAMSMALTEQEQDTIKAYYWDGSTLDRIAKQKNVTRERIRQQIAQAQRKLSRGKAGKILKEYARIEAARYIGGFSFFKHHGSIVEYEVMKKEDILQNSLEKYLEMKRQEQERHKERLEKSKAI